MSRPQLPHVLLAALFIRIIADFLSYVNIVILAKIVWKRYSVAQKWPRNPKQEKARKAEIWPSKLREFAKKKINP